MPRNADNAAKARTCRRNRKGSENCELILQEAKNGSKISIAHTKTRLNRSPCGTETRHSSPGHSSLLRQARRYSSQRNEFHHCDEAVPAPRGVRGSPSPDRLKMVVTFWRCLANYRVVDAQAWRRRGKNNWNFVAH